MSKRNKQAEFVKWFGPILDALRQQHKQHPGYFIFGMDRSIIHLHEHFAFLSVGQNA